MRNLIIILLGLAVGIVVLRITLVRDPVVRNSSIRVTRNVLKENSIIKRYQVNAEYPSATGMDDAKVQMQINSILKIQTTDSIDDFKDQVKKLDESVLPTDFSSGLIVQYELKRDNPDFLSVLYNISDFEAGAAHPNNYVKTVTYAFLGNRFIEINDLFKENSDYLSRLSQISTRELTYQDKKDGQDNSWFIAEGAKPRKENFQFFIVEKDSFTLVFPPYQVGPYAAGIRMVEIPFSQVKDILTPQLFPKIN